MAGQCLTENETLNSSGAMLFGVDEVIYMDEYRIVFRLEDSLFQMEFPKNQGSQGRSAADGQSKRVKEREPTVQQSLLKSRNDDNCDCIIVNDVRLTESNPSKNYPLGSLPSFDKMNTFSSPLSEHNYGLNSLNVNQCIKQVLDEGTWNEIDHIYQDLLQNEFEGDDLITKDEPSTFDLIEHTQLSDVLGGSLTDFFGEKTEINI